MIGVMLIATGGAHYTCYVPQLSESLREFFPPHETVLFTSEEVSRTDVITIPVEDLVWPRATLMRYHTFVKNQDVLSRYSHLFYLDIDMCVKTPIVESEICGEGITAVIHPGFAGTPSKPYCRDRRSTAFIEGNKEYYQGCFQGGSTHAYLDMCKILSRNIDADDANGVATEWYDESYLNRYLFDAPPVIELPPTFAYPEHPEPYPCLRNKEPRIMHIEKSGQETWK